MISWCRLRLTRKSIISLWAWLEVRNWISFLSLSRFQLHWTLMVVRWNTRHVKLRDVILIRVCLRLRWVSWLVLRYLQVFGLSCRALADAWSHGINQTSTIDLWNIKGRWVDLLGLLIRHSLLLVGHQGLQSIRKLLEHLLFLNFYVLAHFWFDLISLRIVLFIFASWFSG